MMTLNKIYEGRDKIIFYGPEKDTLIQRFKDEILINGKAISINGRGCFNNRISQYLMSKLEIIGIKTHFIQSMNMREQLIASLEMFPFRVVVKNSPSKDMLANFSIDKSVVFHNPIIEFFFKSYNGQDIMVNHCHIESFSWASQMQIDIIENLSLRINDFFQGFFLGLNIKLEDISLEFGMHTNYKGEGFIILGDSITIDSLNLLDLSDEIPFAEAKEEAGLVLSVCRDFSYRLGILKLNEKHKQ